MLVSWNVLNSNDYSKLNIFRDTKNEPWKKIVSQLSNVIIPPKAFSVTVKSSWARCLIMAKIE